MRSGSRFEVPEAAGKSEFGGLRLRIGFGSQGMLASAGICSSVCATHLSERGSATTSLSTVQLYLQRHRMCHQIESVYGSQKAAGSEA